MKGRMDLLNRRKRVAAENKSKMFQSGSVSGNVIKIEPNDELDKENCGEDDYITDLTLNDSKEDESMSNDEGSENCKDEVFATEIMEDDDEEMENPDLPVFSVAVKEESRNTRDSTMEGLPLRNKVEIKYEDDIEEEEYDSDDDSIDHYEMNNVNEMGDKVTPINLVNTNGRISKISPAGVPYRSCFNADYFDSNMTNFQNGNQMERSDSLESDMNEDLQNKNDKSSDSILLSIVYATINVPFSQVSKFLTAYNLSKGQLSVIRKVRRQVKNRLYAQNCRKRRVAHIKNLANELQQIKVEKEKLCSVRDDLIMKKIDMENRYNQLYAYVINTLAEQHRNEEFDFSDSDSNMNDSSDDTKLLKRKLDNEYEELEIKKQKIEQKYKELYEHVFRVIKSRHENNTLPRNGMDGSLDFQLCHMDIVNELAMLHKYWTKNKLQQSNEHMDFESSISADGSQTSENKLNDFVDYESSISIADSRCDESKLNDFIDCESSVDYNIQQNIVAHYQNGVKDELDSNEVVVLDDDDDDDDDEDDNASNEDDELDIRTNYPEPDSSSQNKPTDKDCKIDDESLIIWSEEEEEEDANDEEDDDDDDLDQDIREYITELCKQKETFENEKSMVQERYEALYEHVFKALKISETEFLKTLLDYCIGLMKPLAVQPSVPKSGPGGSTNKLEGS